MADLATILPVTLAFEGGWADNPKDPGGATMKGITFATFKQFFPGRTVTQLRDISDADVQHIYDVGYFTPISGSTLTQGVSMVAFDYGVNSGVSRAKNVLASTSALSGVPRVTAISNARLSFLHALSTWKYFGTDWGRRVGEAEAQGIKWETISPAAASVTMKASATTVRKTATAHTTVAVASTATVPTSFAVPTQISTTTELIIFGVVIAVAAVFGILAFHNSQRASALEKAS